MKLSAFFRLQICNNTNFYKDIPIITVLAVHPKQRITFYFVKLSKTNDHKIGIAVNEEIEVNILYGHKHV